MKNLIIPFIIVILISSCSKEPDFLYDSNDSVYFNFEDTASSRITYTFAYDPGLVEDTIYLPVKISGKRVSSGRSFKIAVIDSATTASPSLHYEAFKASYEIPADSGTLSLPVIIYNKDPQLDVSTVTLAFTLQASDDFQVNFPNMITGKISFSNRLEQPAWWIYWMSSLGLYSRVKHQLFLISSGTIEMPDMSQPDAYLQVPKALYHVAQYKAFLSDPFTWVQQNPEYTLTEKANGDYDFYLKEASEKVIVLQRNPGSGIYYFIDENGQTIS
jgi:hypothetical protein